MALEVSFTAEYKFLCSFFFFFFKTSRLLYVIYQCINIGRRERSAKGEYERSVSVIYNIPIKHPLHTYVAHMVFATAD